MNRVYINNSCLGKYHGLIPAYMHYKGYKGYEYLTYSSPIIEQYNFSYRNLFNMFIWAIFNKNIIKKIKFNSYGNIFSAYDEYYNKDIFFILKHLLKFKKQYLIEFC